MTRQRGGAPNSGSGMGGRASEARPRQWRDSDAEREVELRTGRANEEDWRRNAGEKTEQNRMGRACLCCISWSRRSRGRYWGSIGEVFDVIQ
jgi:hypothetical protein